MNMFEMLVEDIFTITGSGTVFVGRIRSGSISIGDPVICKTRSTEVHSRVTGLQEPGSGRLLKSAEAGSTTVGVVCRTIDQSSLSDAFEGEGDSMRVVGVTLVLGTKKPWWKF